MWNYNYTECDFKGGHLWKWDGTPVPEGFINSIVWIFFDDRQKYKCTDCGLRRNSGEWNSRNISGDHFDGDY